jgi:DNA-directed RNA polymerase subunit RPC12/RpoP
MGTTNPSTSWLKVQNNDHLPQNGKQIQCDVCSTKDKPGKDLNVQSAKWCFVLTLTGFKCQNCNS